MGKGRSGSARNSAPTTGAPPTAATEAARPPTSASAFAKLAQLRQTIRAADTKIGQAAPPRPVTKDLRRAAQAPTPSSDLRADKQSDENDTTLFRQAVGQVAPIRAQGRARIEQPKPPPVPRPRDEARETPEPSAGTHRSPKGPQTDSELFRATVGAVTPVRDSGRIQLDRPLTSRYRHPASDMKPPAAADAETPGKLGTPVLPALSDADAPGDMFRRAVGAVAPLPERNRARIERPLPPPAPRQTEADEDAVLHEAISGPLSFEDRLDMGDEAAFLRDGIARRVLTDLRRGRWVVQAQLDLHGLTREEARDALGRFLAESLQHGHRCLRLIHGKGLGSPGQTPVLKHLSRAWLARREDILAFCQARPQDGGDGALLILLRAPRADRSSNAATK